MLWFRFFNPWAVPMRHDPPSAARPSGGVRDAVAGSSRAWRGGAGGPEPLGARGAPPGSHRDRPHRSGAGAARAWLVDERAGQPPLPRVWAGGLWTRWRGQGRGRAAGAARPWRWCAWRAIGTDRRARRAGLCQREPWRAAPAPRRHGAAEPRGRTPGLIDLHDLIPLDRPDPQAPDLARRVAAFSDGEGDAPATLPRKSPHAAHIAGASDAVGLALSAPARAPLTPSLADGPVSNGGGMPRRSGNSLRSAGLRETGGGLATFLSPYDSGAWRGAIRERRANALA